MKTTMIKLINALQVFNNTFMNKEFTPVTSFKLVKLTKAISSEVEIYDKERIKLLEKYGVKNDETNTYKILDENKEKWDKDINDLNSMEVEITTDNINLANENIKISPVDMMYIEDFVDIG